MEVHNISCWLVDGGLDVHIISCLGGGGMDAHISYWVAKGEWAVPSSHVGFGKGEWTFISHVGGNGWSGEGGMDGHIISCWIGEEEMDVHISCWVGEGGMDVHIISY